MNIRPTATLVFVCLAWMCLAWTGSVRAGQTGGGLYLMTNSGEENAVRYFLKDETGELVHQGSYSTGGLGSGITDHSFFNPLGSQSSLILSPDQQWLFCVNAGSDEISVFRVGPEPELVDTAQSGGSFPVSLAFSRGVLYVLNAGGEANLTGFRVDRGGILSRIISSTRALDLEFKEEPPDTETTPAQIGFSPGGDYLIVTLKQGREADLASEILVYAVGRDDLPAAEPAVIVSQAEQAFGFAFDLWGHLAVAETGGSVSSYQITDDGGLEAISSRVRNGEEGTAWIARNGPTGRYLYAANYKSGTLTGYLSDGNGELTLLNSGGVTEDVGRSSTRYPSGLAASGDGRYLYVLNRSTRSRETESSVNVFGVEEDGQLDYLDEINDLDQTAQGLAAF